MDRYFSGPGFFRVALVSGAVTALATVPATAEQTADGEQIAANRPQAVDAPSGVDVANFGTQPEITGAGGPVFVGAATVREVQQKLNQKGFEAGDVDGIFGPRTSMALCTFQKAQGLEPSGGITLTTLQRLGLTAARKGADGDKQVVDVHAVPVMVGRANIRQVQQAIAAAELGWNALDGMWTTTFSHALRAWQEAQGLERTGTITVETLSLVGSVGPTAEALAGGKTDETGTATMAEDLAEQEGGRAAATVAEPGADGEDFSRVHCGGVPGHADPYVTQLYLGPTIIRVVEEALSEAGHDPGELDGIFDTRLSYALVRYQNEQGLEPTGTLTVQTIGRLGFGEVLQGTGS